MTQPAELTSALRVDHGVEVTHVPVPATEINAASACTGPASPVPGLAYSGAPALRRDGAAADDAFGGRPIPRTVLSALLRRARSGAELPAQLRGPFEGATGHDLSEVRVHHDEEADRLARSVSSTAFTFGTDIYFTRGSYQPGSAHGLHMLAHELAHVSQPVRGVGGVIGRHDDPDERAADATAAQVVAALRRSGAGAQKANLSPAAPPAQDLRRLGGPSHPIETTAADQSTSGVIRLVVTDDRSTDSVGTDLMLRRILVKLATEKVEGTARRVIVDVEVEGRVPTTVSGGQGDHSIAETLIVEAIRGICKFQNYWDAYGKLLGHADTFAAKNLIGRYDCEEIVKEFRRVNAEEFQGADAEDQASHVTTLIEHLIRAANKVPNAAFDRSAGVTEGAAGLEKPAIEKLRMLKEQGLLDTNDLFGIAQTLAGLLDYKVFDDVLAQKAAAIVKLAAASSPNLSTRMHLLAPLFADALATTRFKDQLNGGHRLAQAMERYLGFQGPEVDLKTWGEAEAKQSPQEANGLIAPEFEAHLHSVGARSAYQSPTSNRFQTTPLPPPRAAITMREKGAPGGSVGQILARPDGPHLIVEAVPDVTGGVDYGLAKLAVLTDASATPTTVVGATVNVGADIFLVVQINADSHGMHYFLAKTA